MNMIMMQNNYLAGSVWRRWDLHIHTPESVLNNQFEGSNDNEKWEKYIKKLEDLEGVCVVGATDYYSVEGYKKLQQAKDGGRLKKIDLILPNCEGRLDIQTKRKGGVNIHFIFNPYILDDLDTWFFSTLSFDFNDVSYNGTRGCMIALGRKFKSDPNLDETVAFKEGCNQFKISTEQVQNLLKNKDLKNNMLIAVSGKEDGTSGIQESSFGAKRRDIIKISDIIFSSNEKDREYFLGKGIDSEQSIKSKYGFLKPCLHGCDAHSLDNVGKVYQDRFCWVKADPTFEGLKQVVIEPEGRVKIQKNNPMEAFRRPYFSHIRSETKKVFEDEPLETSEISLSLNPYMCCIIGGRGTGKSLLLDLIKKTFNLDLEGEKRRCSKIIHPEFNISYKKTDGDETKYSLGGDENDIDYLHVSQGEVKEIVVDSKKLDKEIKRMVGISEETFGIADSNLTYIKEISIAIQQLQSIGNDGQLRFSKERLNKIIRRNQNLIKTITTKENRVLVQEYQKYQKQIIKNQETIDLLREEKEAFLGFQKEKNTMLKFFSEIYDEINIPEISFDDQIGAMRSVFDRLKDAIGKLKEKNIQIEKQLREKGVEGDVERTFSRVTEYQKNIVTCEAELDEMNEIKNNLKKQFEKLKQESSSEEERLNNIVNKIKSEWEAIKSGKDLWDKEQKKLHESLIEDIDVNAKIHLSKDIFYEVLERNGLNMKKFRRSKKDLLENKLETAFNVKDAKSYFQLIANEKVINIDDEPAINIQDFLRREDFFNDDGEFLFLNALYFHESRSKYLQVISKIKYMGKSPEQLSVGQRGTFFLCLKLATHTFGIPFIFDQPEDDLDNDFIVKSLVPILKEVKKYRQVILVTHNANIVVNSDSEQVIVAKNENEKLFYVSGSIESTHIVDPLNKNKPKKMKEHICNILEGGLDAFRRREQRYDL